MPVLDAPDIRGRQLVQQLTDDLGWLEGHTRQSGQAHHASRLRLAAALVRNCIGPFLENAPPAPLHAVVVGGAGAGKSTIANFLTGTAVAEANPQAGFTRHPIAYTSSNGPPVWSQYIGFLGPLQRLFDAQPSNLDQDVYQLRRVTPPEPASSVLHQFIVWDCPDMTTWQATGYVSRLMEVAALADLIVYVASDERYNDEVPTQFLQLVLQAGKPVIACIMKMSEDQASIMTDHFRSEVVARIPECTRVLSCLAVPHMTQEELADPVRLAGRYRQPLLDQVTWWGQRPAERRQAVVRGAVDFLTRFQENLLTVARDDLAALRAWRDLVSAGRSEFEGRYYREYLSAEKFPRFNEALVRLIQLLELPGIGQYLSKAVWVVRTPYRLVRGLLAKIAGPPAEAKIPEEPVLEAALIGWLDLLRKEAAKREDNHPLWDHVEKGFQGKLKEQFREEFQRCLRDFQIGLANEVEVTARAIYEDLEKHPIALNSLRTGKFALEAGSIIGILLTGGIGWHDLLILLVTPLIQELVELLGKQYVDLQRERARLRQQELFVRCLALPLADWLVQWPATGGSTYERLQTALRRIPEEIAELTQTVRQRLGEQAT